MGRLLRKKTSVKKKKQPGDETATSSALSEGAEPGMAVSSDVSSDARKKEVAVPKKPLSMTKPAPTPQSNPDSVVNKSTQFLREVRAELRKVTWPSRNQTLGSTVVVIILVLIIASFLGVVDIALSSFVHGVLG